MKTTSIGLWANDSQIVNFNLTGPDVSNPYRIKAITGLDIEEMMAQYYSTGLASGKKFSELVMKPREITMRIDLKPNYRLSQHPADLRAKILRAISASRDPRIQLRFNDDICWGAIQGFVTKFEAPVTSRDTEIQFTMRCDDPIIRSLNVTSQLDLEFDEIANPILNDPISTWPHGFKFKLTFTANQTGLSIFDGSASDWSFIIDYDFETDDELYFSSEYGDKYLFVIRAAVTTQLMDTIQPGSVWPLIFPGENLYAVTNDNFVWNEIYWYETHGGI